MTSGPTCWCWPQASILPWTIRSKGFAIATPEFAIIGNLISQLKLPTLVVQEGGYPSPSLGLNLASLLKGLNA